MRRYFARCSVSATLHTSTFAGLPIYENSHYVPFSTKIIEISFISWKYSSRHQADQNDIEVSHGALTSFYFCCLYNIYGKLMVEYNT